MYIAVLNSGTPRRSRKMPWIIFIPRIVLFKDSKFVDPLKPMKSFGCCRAQRLNLVVKLAKLYDIFYIYTPTQSNVWVGRLVVWPCLKTVIVISSLLDSLPSIILSINFSVFCDRIFHNFAIFFQYKYSYCWDFCLFVQTTVCTLCMELCRVFSHEFGELSKINFLVF